MSSVLEMICVAEQRGENERKPEISSQAGCAPSPVIDAEERALLNLLKFDSRVKRRSRGTRLACPRGASYLLSGPSAGMKTCTESDRKTARMERTSSMSERLQTRAEIQKAAVASVDSIKAL